MDDDARSAATRTVYRHLRRAAFRECLPVLTSDGDRPVIVALPDDRVASVVRQVRAAGGSGNVVVARSADLVVLAVTRDGRGAVPVPSEGTVGEFITCLMNRPEVAHQRSVRRGDRGAARPVSVPVFA